MRPAMVLAIALALPGLLLLVVALFMVAPSAAIAWWVMRRSA